MNDFYITYEVESVDYSKWPFTKTTALTRNVMINAASKDEARCEFHRSYSCKRVISIDKV